MKKLLLYLTVLIICGCSDLSTAENKLNSPTILPTPTFVECPQKPIIRLDKADKIGRAHV